MFTADRAQEVLPLLRHPFAAVFLYGSYARRDAEGSSDVDILQVTVEHSPPYSIGPFNVTCYTFDQLLRLARSGGLFARHIVEEAVALRDPQGLLAALKSQYVAPGSYGLVRSQARGCAPLLDVEESQFNQNSQGLSSLASYLVRTFLYASAFDRGARSFSMRHVLDVLGEQSARAVLSDLRQRSFPAFLAGRGLFEHLTGVICRRTEGSVEAFIVNAAGSNELASILGLRLLARGRPFTYDALQDLEL